MDCNTKNTLITILITAFVTWGGIFLTATLSNNHSNKEKKQLLISELEGLRVWRSQLYVSRFESEIKSDYYEYRYHKLGNQLDQSEFLRLAHEAEKQTLEVAKANQLFLEKLGYVSILFPKNPDMVALIEENRNFGSPLIQTRPNHSMSIEELDKWHTQTMTEVKNLIDVNYGEKPKKLIEKLKELL